MLRSLGWEEACGTDSVPQFTFTSKKLKQITTVLNKSAGPGWEAEIEGEQSVSNVGLRRVHTRWEYAYNAHWKPSTLNVHSMRPNVYPAYPPPELILNPSVASYTVYDSAVRTFPIGGKGESETEQRIWVDCHKHLHLFRITLLRNLLLGPLESHHFVRMDLHPSMFLPSHSI